MLDNKSTGPAMASINGYIDEFEQKRATKEYANSFRVQRQKIEEMLDAGYVVVDEEKDGHLYQQKILLSPIEQIVTDRENEKNKVA